jgi:hypothetical protein
MFIKLIAECCECFDDKQYVGVCSSPKERRDQVDLQISTPMAQLMVQLIRFFLSDYPFATRRQTFASPSLLIRRRTSP